jgi:hypothetical protein
MQLRPVSVGMHLIDDRNNLQRRREMEKLENFYEINRFLRWLLQCAMWIISPFGGENNHKLERLILANQSFGQNGP